MAFRIPTAANTYLYSAAAFTHTTGATLIGMFKVVTDQDADQAVLSVFPLGMEYRHELIVGADGNLRATVNWGTSSSGSLGAAVGSGWMWGAIRISRVAGAPRIKFWAKTHPAGSVLTADLTDGGAEAAAGAPITYRFNVGGGVAPWVANGGIDAAYIKAYAAALTDDEVIAEMNAFALVRATNKHSYLTAISKANVAAALTDESGVGNNWSQQGTTLALNDAANPSAFGGTQPTVTIGSVAIVGQSVQLSGTFTSAGTGAAISVQLQAGASGVSQGPTAATIDGSNWSLTFLGVPAGVYTPRATITDSNGSVLATGSSLEIVGLSGAGILPHVYSAGSISMTPESASVGVGLTQVLTITDANGLPLDGVVVTSLSPAVASVTSPSNLLGQVTVTGVAAGSASIVATYSDPTAGTLSDSTAIAVALATPAAPTNLSAVALGSSSVRLAWQDNSSNETGFIVERAPQLAGGGAGTFASILTPGVGVVTVDDTTVVPGTTYFYRVKATNGSGPSAPSNVASVAVPAAPDITPPTIALTASSQAITIPNSTIRLRAAASDDRGVTEVRFYRNGVQIGGMLTAPNDGNQYAVDLTFGSAAENGTVAFTARAWDAAGNSTLSSPVPVVVNIPAGAVVPAAPSNLEFTDIAATSMAMKWKDNSTDETAFLVERRTENGVWGQVASLPAGTTTYEATGLLSSTTYYWRVRAQGAQGPSGYSNEAWGVTSPPAPTGLDSLTVSPGTVSGVAGATATVTYTAVNGNGSTRPGVTVTPSVSNAGVASVAPINGVTDASGMVSFVVTFGAEVAQADLTVSASDGQTTIAPSVAPKVQLFSLPTVTLALVKEFQAEQTDPKYASEITPIVWDYSPFLGRGELPTAIVDREVIPTTGQDRDPASADMLFGDGVIVGDRVLQWVRDGVPGVSYYLRCRVRTSLGRVVIAEFRLRIYRQVGARVSSSSPVIE